MDIKVRKFSELNKSQLYSIFHLRSEVFVVEQDCSYQDLDGRDQEAIHFFVEDGGKIIAYERLIEIDGDIYIGRVVVDKSYRGRGLAKSLLEEAIAYAFKNYDNDSIYIEAQSYLIEFYGSIGFTRISEDYLLDNILHCKMRIDRIEN